MSRFMRDDVLSAVQELRPIADDLGISMAQLALAWVLRELGDDVLARIDNALAPDLGAVNAP